MTDELRAALAAMKKQLDWQGPTGRTMGHVVLERQQAARVYAALEDAMTDLTGSERDLLKWLGQEDFSQYGECHGTTLDSLIAKGFAQVHEPGQHQNFIANDFGGTKGDMYRAVSLTEAGRNKLRELRS